jgi:hypothetical protein
LAGKKIKSVFGKTPLQRINEFLEREKQRTDWALTDEKLTRVRMALFGCAPK